MPIQTKGGMRLEYRDVGLKKVLKQIEKTSALKLRVGVVGAKAAERTADGRLTNAENAVIQMFGLAGPPGSPARDFLNQPFRDKKSRIATILRRVAGRIVKLQETPEMALDWAGKELAEIPKTAIDFSPRNMPRNAPVTVARKGFDHPLVETRGLQQSISHRIVRTTGDVLESGSAVGDFEAFEIGGNINPNAK